MAYLDDLKGKAVKKEEEFNFALLLSFVETNNIPNRTELLEKLDEQIDECVRLLAVEKVPSTISGKRREWTKKLEEFKKIKEMVFKYA